MATSTTEIGRSSTAIGSRDLVFKNEEMFEYLCQHSAIVGVISVPNHLRKLDEQAFTPLLFSIGPIHRSNAKLQAMRKLKVQLCQCFIKQANSELSDLVLSIKVREKEIRSYYAETILSSISSDDFVTMVLVDGMFILEVMRQSLPRLLVDDSTIRIQEWMLPILRFDLVLLENQLPLFVLEMLFCFGISEAQFRLTPLSLKQLAVEFFECFRVEGMSPCSIDTRIENFTDLVRFFHVSGREQHIGLGRATLSYSASQLHDVGVELKVAPEEYGRHFLDIRFSLVNGVLEIPCIELDDEKIRLFRNIIALEQSYHVGHAYVTDFFVILDSLINTSKDVDLLCDKGILVNNLGGCNVGASVVNSLNARIIGGYMNEEYLKICEDLNASFKQHWYKKLWYEQLWYLWREQWHWLRAQWHGWREMLWEQYFSTPWRAASTSSAIILLVLTAIQTVCSLKSTKW